jgi:hypothetical protein
MGRLLIIVVLFCTSAFAGSFRVHYSIRGSGRDVTVQAESSAVARRTVMDRFPGVERTQRAGLRFGPFMTGELSD